MISVRATCSGVYPMRLTMPQRICDMRRTKPVNSTTKSFASRIRRSAITDKIREQNTTLDYLHYDLREAAERL